MSHGQLSRKSAPLAETGRGALTKVRPPSPVSVIGCASRAFASAGHNGQIKEVTNDQSGETRFC